MRKAGQSRREKERERDRERRDRERERGLHANAPSVKEKVFNEFFLSTATASSVMSVQHAHSEISCVIVVYV